MRNLRGRFANSYSLKKADVIGQRPQNALISNAPRGRFLEINALRRRFNNKSPMKTVPER